MKIEKLSSNRVKFTFVVTVADFDHALDHAFDHARENVEVKGFRKGKVTRTVFENKFGVEALFEDALNHVFHHKYHDALANEEYQLVGDPQPIVDFADVAVGKEFEIGFEIAVKPDVELGNYKGLEVEKLSNEVTEDEVNAQIQTLVDNATSLEPKTEGALVLGDTAIFDYEGFKDGKPFEGGAATNHEMEIGSGQFIPGFEDQMVGMTVGETKDVNVIFPAEYHEESLAGAPVTFSVTLHEMKQKVAPEVNDEWVASLGNEEKTLEALKASILTNLTTNKTNANKNQSLDAALKLLAASSKVDIPVEMINYENEQALANIEKQAKQYGLDLDTYVQLTGMTKEQLNESITEESTSRLLNSLLIEEVAKKEAFEIKPEEVEAKFAELAEQYQVPVEEIKRQLNVQLVIQDLQFTKAIDVIYDNLKFK